MTKLNKFFALYSVIMIGQAFAFYKVKVETGDIELELFLIICLFMIFFSLFAYALSTKSRVFSEDENII